MSLSELQKKHLRKLAHGLKPVVMVGQAGLTEGVLGETRTCLEAHELIKVKVSAGDREVRDRIIEELVNNAQAELIQRIGNMAVLYRANPEAKHPLELPKA